MTILYTSLAEIKSFQPCSEGWQNILEAQGKTKADDTLFPLKDCLNSNSFFDVCWLLGKRKVEIQIAVIAAKLCAESVSHLNKSAAANAAEYVDYAAKAAEYANAAADYVANAAAEYVDYAAKAAEYAANAAVDYVEYAANAAADAANAADAAEYAATSATWAGRWNWRLGTRTWWWCRAAADAAANAAANDAYAAAYTAQIRKNKQFLLDAILQYENTH